jgi:hypothetical protein
MMAPPATPDAVTPASLVRVTVAPGGEVATEIRAGRVASTWIRADTFCLSTAGGTEHASMRLLSSGTAST